MSTECRARAVSGYIRRLYWALQWLSEGALLVRGTYVACISERAAGPGGVLVAMPSHNRDQSRKTYIAEIAQVETKYRDFLNLLNLAYVSASPKFIGYAISQFLLTLPMSPNIPNICNFSEFYPIPKLSQLPKLSQFLPTLPNFANFVDFRNTGPYYPISQLPHSVESAEVG